MSYINLLPYEGALSDKIHYVSSGKDENDWASLPHLHRFSELILITGGDGHFVAGEKFHAIKKGDFIVVPAGIMHTEVSAASPLSYYAVGFTGNLFSGAARDNFIYGLNNRTFGQLEPCFALLLSELSRKQKNCIEIAANCIDNILLLTERVTERQKNDSAQENPPKIRAAAEYIDHNYSKDISLDELCALSFVSKTHLIRLFKQYTGYTPVVYIIRRRIQAAKTLLITTDFSVMETAMALNFPTSSYFILKFKKYAGTTPLKYRAMYRRDKNL